MDFWVGKITRKYGIFKKDPVVGFNDVLNIAKDRIRKPDILVNKLKCLH